MPDVHPATEQKLNHFAYGHLPPNLQQVSAPFHDLAHKLVHELELAGPELTIALSKLWEAKNNAVMALIDADQ